MIIKSKSLAIILVSFIFGGILFSTWMNWWQTESDKTPNRYSKGEFQGEFDPSDIRGSYSFGDIEASFNIPAVLLAEAFGISPDIDAFTFKLNGLETIYSWISILKSELLRFDYLLPGIKDCHLKSQKISMFQNQRLIFSQTMFR